MKEEMEQHEGFLVVDAATGNERYEWSFIAALYHPENKAYYLYEDGGCSCNYPFERNYWDAGPPMNKKDLVKELNSIRSDDTGLYLRLEDYHQLAQSVHEFDPDKIP